MHYCAGDHTQPTLHPQRRNLFRFALGFLQMSGGGLVPLSHAICCRPCHLRNSTDLPLPAVESGFQQSLGGASALKRAQAPGDRSSNALPDATMAAAASFSRFSSRRLRAGGAADGSSSSGGGAAVLAPVDHGPLSPDVVPDHSADVSPQNSKAGGGKGDAMHALNIVSIGCHQSSGTGPDSLQCEAAGNSFVTGALWLRLLRRWPLPAGTGAAGQCPRRCCSSTRSVRLPCGSSAMSKTSLRVHIHCCAFIVHRGMLHSC